MRNRLGRMVLAAGLASAACGAIAQAPVVAAAADLKFALTEIADAYRSETGREVRLTFGSSGNFAQQIENGAPFEVFMSADEQFVARLASRGLTRDDGVLYAVGRIVLFVPHGSPLKPDATLADLRAAAADGRLTRFAIANPEHAPYGRAAQEALEAAGAWPAVRPALVLGENAAQATQFATEGGAQGGIIPYSLARAPVVARLGTASLIAASLHRPLRQRMVLTKRSGPVAADFYAWLQRDEARRIFVRYGFVLPNEGG